MTLDKLTVYCASSPHCDERFLDAADRLGRLMAGADVGVVYGGGGVGLMGRLADAALEERGRVTGVIPRFMIEREWAHGGVEDLQIVDHMHTRKERMISLACGMVALPGGCGTLEEVLEAITWKRLDLHTKPIVIVNMDGFYDPLLAQLRDCIDQRFMTTGHGELWTAVERVEDVLPTVRHALGDGA